MAMRLACPACGATFGPDPADAGRVLPCPGCGRSIQMPPARPVAAKPIAPKPVTRRDPRPEPEPARGWLLALAVLFGSGLVGLGIGAGTYFAIDRAPPQVAEKPPTPPVQDPPAVPPPKTDPPKTDLPKIDSPVPPPAPKPKDPPPAAPAGARAIPGLKFYLPLDATADGKVTEAVSGKPVGTGVGLAVTDGPRGKPAVRLTHDRADANRHALNLSDQKGAFTIPAGRPFTLAFWARRTRTDTNSGTGAFLLEARTDPNDLPIRILTFQMLPSTPAFVAVSLNDASNRMDPGTLRTAHPSGTVPDPTAWNHFALVRDGTGRVHFLVNGTENRDVRPALFPGELRYDSLTLLGSSDRTTVVDMADLCLYDRELTDAELGALTGLKVAPLAPVPALAEGKPIAPGAVPAATGLTGLRFYLPCDRIEGGSLVEAVSGKSVGTGRKLEAVDGPRGKAARVTAGGPGGGREGFDLSAQADALAVEEGKPFTLALWVRTEDWDSMGGTFIHGQLSGKDLFRFFAIARGPKTYQFYIQQGKPGGRPDPINQRAAGLLDAVPTKGWTHFALTRDEKGTVRWAVNGAVTNVAPTPYTAELRFSTIALAYQVTGSFTAEFDEFCLFDRALTDDELGWLAGGKPVPKAVAVAPKDPLEVAPPPRAVVAVAAPPKDPPAPVVLVKVSAPAGVDPKGLKVYLPFEELNDGTVREGASGKFLGECAGVALVAGPRGKAARIAIERADGGQGTCKLDFADVAERVEVPAGKPFTLALWVREEARDPMSRGGSTVLRLAARPNREYDRALQIGFGANGVVHFSARSTPDRLDPKRETAAQWATVANAAKWQHIAIVRDEKNAVRGYLNGKHVPSPGKPDPVWDGPLGYDRFLFGDPDQLRTVLEVDEFCLFERALTVEELKKLAEPAK